MTQTQHSALDKVTAQLERYSPGTVHLWKAAHARWTPDIRTWLNDTLTQLQQERSDLVYNRLPMIVRYKRPPSDMSPVLVFGQLQPRGGRFVKGTDQLLITLDGRQCHKFWGVMGVNTTLRYNGEGV